jgi:CheY-like chemotaxis protein
VRSLPMKLVSVGNHFAALRLQLGNGLPMLLRPTETGPSPHCYYRTRLWIHCTWDQSAPHEEPSMMPLPVTVLVVDDEEPLRHYMGRIMANDGYRVLVAGNGLEALALLEQCAPGIHLVITDVAMPMMTGPEMAACIATQPEPPPVLFVSGGHGYADLPGPLLKKPFRPDDLSRLVRWLLGGRTEPSSIAGVGAV